MKKQIEAARCAPSVASIARQVPADAASSSEDWAENILRSLIQWQIEQIQMKPSNHTPTVNRRARQARTMTELVNTLNKLDAVQKRRDGKGRKVKPRDYSTIREDFIRRLDQLLAARGEEPLPGKSEPE
jgi:hypothetical protein